MKLNLGKPVKPGLGITWYCLSANLRVRLLDGLRGCLRRCLEERDQ